MDSRPCRDDVARPVAGSIGAGAGRPSAKPAEKGAWDTLGWKTESCKI